MLHTVGISLKKYGSSPDMYYDVDVSWGHYADAIADCERQRLYDPIYCCSVNWSTWLMDVINFAGWKGSRSTVVLWIFLTLVNCSLKNGQEVGRADASIDTSACFGNMRIWVQIHITHIRKPDLAVCARDPGTVWGWRQEYQQSSLALLQVQCESCIKKIKQRRVE